MQIIFTAKKNVQIMCFTIGVIFLLKFRYEASITSFLNLALAGTSVNFGKFHDHGKVVRSSSFTEIGEKMQTICHAIFFKRS